MRGVSTGLKLLLVCCFGGAGCGMPVSEEGNHQGPGHRSQQLALSPDQELLLGRKASRQVLHEYQGRILSRDRPEVQRVHHVCWRIIRAAGIRPLQREINLHVQGCTFEWEVHVLEDDQINAFCLPTGKIFVFTGILPVAKDDGQLATVLSHEIAHALAHHASERVAWDQSGRVNFLQAKAYDRAQESEADHIGVFLMTFAGYDPEKAIRFWQRMMRVSQEGKMPAFLSDHPPTARRIRDLEGWVPKARAAKEAWDEGRIAPEPDRTSADRKQPD